MGTINPVRDEDEDDLAAAWGERSEGWLHKYLPYVVGLLLAGGILWWGAVPQFRQAGLGTATAGVDLVPAVIASEGAHGLNGIGVSGDGGVITLTGTVASVEERNRAIAAAASVAGVTQVIDMLTIQEEVVVTPSRPAPQPTPTPTPEPVASATPTPEPTPSATAVAGAPAAATVTVSNAGVVLAGTVGSEEIKATLVAAAQKAFPGKVTDQLTVSGLAEGATVAYSGAVTQAQSDALLAPQADLRGTGAKIDNKLVVGAGVGDAINKLLAREPILFDTGTATLRPASQKTLQQVAAIMKENPKVSLEVQGHTDSQGSDASNQKLSTLRAQAVMAYLVKNGVPANRLTAVGYGETKPVAPNDTAAGRQLNRRIQFAEK